MVESCIQSISFLIPVQILYRILVGHLNSVQILLVFSLSKIVVAFFVVKLTELDNKIVALLHPACIVYTLIWLKLALHCALAPKDKMTCGMYLILQIFDYALSCILEQIVA